MTQENTPVKPKSQLPFLFLIAAIALGNLWGLYYLYQEHQTDKLAFKNAMTIHLQVAKDLKNQLLTNLEQLSNLKKELDLIRQNQKQMSLQKQDNQLLQIEWLIRRAEWQLNILKQIRYSKSYLRQARKLAESYDLNTVADAIHQDMLNLNHLGITPLHQILSKISEVKHALDALNIPLSKTPTLKTTAQTNINPKIQRVIQLLQPFIKIEHYHETPAKIITADDKQIILKNLELLLAEIQYAAICSEQDVFNYLLASFEQEAAGLDKTAHLQALIEDLKNIKTGITKPIHLSSLSLVQQLIQEKSAS